VCRWSLERPAGAVVEVRERGERKDADHNGAGGVGSRKMGRKGGKKRRERKRKREKERKKER